MNNNYVMMTGLLALIGISGYAVQDQLSKGDYLASFTPKYEIVQVAIQDAAEISGPAAVVTASTRRFDLDNDGFIDIKDMEDIGDAYTRQVYDVKYDFNNDSKVDLRDIAALRRLMGKSQYNLIGDQEVVNLEDIKEMARLLRKDTDGAIPYNVVIDFNTDGKLDIKDMSILRQQAGVNAYKKSDGLRVSFTDIQAIAELIDTNEYFALYDINGDGKLENRDMINWRRNSNMLNVVVASTSESMTDHVYNFNRDTKVSAADIIPIAEEIGKTTKSSLYDINSDGKVDINDIQILVTYLRTNKL